MNLASSCTSLKKVFQIKKSEEFNKQPIKQEIVSNKKETVYLHACVQKYLEYSGSIRKSKPITSINERYLSVNH